MQAISLWKKLLEHDPKREKVSQRDANPLKRKAGENETIIAKKLKVEEKQEVAKDHGESQEDKLLQGSPEQGEAVTRTELQDHRLNSTTEKAADAQDQEDLTFRVSCRCTGNVRKVITGQVGSSPEWDPAFQKHASYRTGNVAQTGEEEV